MLFVCLQVNLDAKFVLSNLDAVRRNTSLLVKQGLASDRYLPGLQSHACKRAYGFKRNAEGCESLFDVCKDIHTLSISSSSFCTIAEIQADFVLVFASFKKGFAG